MVCRATPTTDIAGDDNWSATNWSGEVDFVNEKHWRPGTLQELVEIVARATEQGIELRAVGSRWAFEDIATSADWVVALDDLAKPLDYILSATPAALTPFWREQISHPIPDPNADFIPRRLVHVEAGIRVAALSELLENRSLALPTLGGSNGQKLGGVISTSTHGGEWREPPFPDIIRALHLVTERGRELWIEPASSPLTVGDTLPLPCADTQVIRDDEIFNAAIVACGRFGVIYSVVLEVVEKFRVVEDVGTPRKSEVMRALRDGIDSGTLIFQPLFDLLKETPPALPDAVGAEPRFFQILFNSQRPDALWVTRRFVTTEPTDYPATDPNLVTGEADLAPAILASANAFLTSAAINAGGNPFGGIIFAAIITGVQIEMNKYIAERPFTLGNVAAAAVTALWKIHYDEQVRDLNGWIINGRMAKNGRRGVHHLITSGTRAASDDESAARSASIEVVFDAKKTNYLDFLEEIFEVAPRFKQAGYVSLRPSLNSQGLLSMHGVEGTFAMSIEIASLQGLPDNDAWMRYVHDRAILRGGRPHWGQYNKLGALDVAMLYRDSLNRWREALVRVSGTSTVFSNNFCRTRGLEPTSIVREITGARRTRDGVVTHICNSEQSWSPVNSGQAIREIQSGVVRYFVRAAGRLVPIHVVDGSYLRTAPNDTVADNLDSLPGC